MGGDTSGGDAAATGTNTDDGTLDGDTGANDSGVDSSASDVTDASDTAGDTGDGFCEPPPVPPVGIDSCKNVDNDPGPMLDVEWPAASNVGHDALEGQSFHFHWQDPHNVLQVASFEGQAPPLDPFEDAMWPQQIRSGAPIANGAFDWNVGSRPCGWRPGIYFFVDEGNPAAGVMSATITVDPAIDPYPPRPCSDLADPSFHGGRYAPYADRDDCTIYEVNNFTTQAHYDWVPPTFGAKQGDLVIFRWTGEHNVVQVHNVDEDEPRPDWVCNGIHSGAKRNCVGGPHYTCVNGPASTGEFLIDTLDYRPGIIHLSDQCALTCTGHDTGMNFQVGLTRAVRPTPPVAESCCELDGYEHLGRDCRIVDVWNDWDGARFDYNVAVGRGDLIRFRWAGNVRIYQSLPGGPDGSPSAEARPGGVAMAAPVDCTPGPQWSCLQGNTDDAQFIVDVAAALADGNHETFATGQPYFDFWAEGEDIEGYTSASGGALFYVDDAIPYDPTNACP